METEEKRNTGLMVVIILLVIALLCSVGYIVYDKVLSKDKEGADVEEKKKTEKNYVDKINNQKEWIYDANYEKEVLADSYTTGYNEIYYAKDIIVPFINVDSSYAKSSNSKIERVFNDAIESYNSGVSDKYTYVDSCNYKKYQSKDIISVILTYGVGATDVVHPNYYTYNINLKTGDELSFKEIYTLLGFNENDIESKIEEAITTKMKDKMLNFKYPDNYPDGKNFDTYNNESINNYKDSVKNKSLKYFISEDEKLNIIVTLSIPAGTGKFDTIVTV